MNHQVIIEAVLLALAGSFFSFIVSSTLNNHSVARATADNLRAAADNLQAQALQTNNMVLYEIVHGAMAYAEVHEQDILKHFGSKADYVVATVSVDPRFHSFGVGLNVVEQFIEQVWIDFFSPDANKDDHQHA